MVFGSALIVVFSMVGAYLGGATGTMWGTALASWVSALLFWLQLRTALHEAEIRRRGTVGRHRNSGTNSGSAGARDAGKPVPHS